MSLAAVRVCVVYIDFDVFVVRDGVVVHYRDSWEPIGELWVWTGGTEWTWRTERSLENREKQSEASDRLPSPEARG